MTPEEMRIVIKRIGPDEYALALADVRDGTLEENAGPLFKLTAALETNDWDFAEAVTITMSRAEWMRVHHFAWAGFQSCTQTVDKLDS